MQGVVAPQMLAIRRLIAFATVNRLYKDGDEWKQTASFGREDLPLVAKVVDMAHSWTYEQAG